MILAHALLKIDIREKLPRPLVGSPYRSPRRMPSSRESCPPPKRHRVLQQPAKRLTLSKEGREMPVDELLSKLLDGLVPFNQFAAALDKHPKTVMRMNPPIVRI